MVGGCDIDGDGLDDPWMTQGQGSQVGSVDAFFGGSLPGLVADGSRNLTLGMPLRVFEAGLACVDLVGGASPDAVVYADQPYVIEGPFNSGDFVNLTPDVVPRQYDAAISLSSLPVIRVGDVTGDGRPDLVLGESDDGSGNGAVLVVVAGAVPIEARPIVVGSGEGLGWGVGVGDLNGDHVADLVVASSSTTQVRVFLGPFDVSSPRTASDADAVFDDGVATGRVVAVTDLDGDSVPDLLLWRAGLSDRLSVVSGAKLMRSAGTVGSEGVVAEFRDVGAPPTTVAARCVAADVNGDGRSDVACGQPNWTDSSSVSAKGRVLVYLQPGP